MNEKHLSADAAAGANDTPVASPERQATLVRELLAALKRVTWELKHTRDCQLGNDETGMEACRDAEVVIAKAEGR